MLTKSEIKIKIRILQERYKTLSEIEDFYPKRSKAKPYVYIQNQMKKTLEELSQFKQLLKLK